MTQPVQRFITHTSILPVTRFVLRQLVRPAVPTSIVELIWGDAEIYG